MEFFLLMKGLPGCGKSTLAAALARELRCPLVDKDDARDMFQPVVSQAPDLDWNGLSYDVMFRVAERQLGLGLSVVADCPFARVSLYQRALELVSKVERLQCAPAAFAGSARHEAADQQQSLLPPATIRPPAEAVGTAPAGDTPCGSAFEPPEEGCKRSTTGSNLKQETRLLVVVVDVECSDEGLWRRRLDARGAEDAGTERSHKPGSWEQLQDLLSRYGDSWKWSTSGSAHVPYHVRVDTTAASTAECVATVLGYLKALKQAPRGGSSAATAGL